MTSPEEGQIHGTIRKINATNGFAAVETRLGEYTIVELLSGDVDEGDVIDGDLQSLGSATLVRVRTGGHLRVFIQDCRASAVRADDLLTKA